MKNQFATRIEQRGEAGKTSRNMYPSTSLSQCSSLNNSSPSKPRPRLTSTTPTTHFLSQPSLPPLLRPPRQFTDILLGDDALDAVLVGKAFLQIAATVRVNDQRARSVDQESRKHVMKNNYARSEEISC